MKALAPLLLLALTGAVALSGCGEVAAVSGCSTKADCDPSEICVNHKCVSFLATDAAAQCTANTDCDAPEDICWLPEGQCVQCLENTDCDAQMLCVNHTCRWTLGGCGSSADCALPELSGTPVCDQSANICVECVATTDCRTGGVCNAGHHCDAVTMPPDAGPPDAGAPDAGPPDAGPRDAGAPDAGPPDAGPRDAGPPDAGPPDAGPRDAGPPDAGPPDAGPRDAGPADAGPPDAGPPDAGPPDAGPPDAGVMSLDAGHAGPYCSSSGDCSGSTRFCFTDTQTCVGCVSDSNCPGSSDTCSNSYQCGRSGGCSSNSDCAGREGRPICNTNYGLCGMGCLRDADCTSGMTPKCRTATNKCVVCLTSADCGAGQTCSTTNYTCVP